jgi:hypothetical protein
MTERERWVVYPLLFLALGAALRDKLFDRTTSRVIVCQELRVVDEDITGQRPGRLLAWIRPERAIGSEPIGTLDVNGRIIRINGELLVGGSVLAKNYSFFPGGSWEALWRGLQQSLRGGRPEDGPEAKPGRESTPPADAGKSSPESSSTGRNQEHSNEESD